MVLSPPARSSAAFALVLATALALHAAPARALAPPDSAHLARLQAACDSAWRVRVTGHHATYQLNRPRLDARGVQIEHVESHPALVTVGDPPPARTLAWADIEKLETERSNAGKGALIGFGIGAAIGGISVATTGPDLAEEDDNVMVFYATLAVLMCGTIGLLFGLANSATTPLYP